MLSDHSEISQKTQTHNIGLPKGSLFCFQTSKQKSLCEKFIFFAF